MKSHVLRNASARSIGFLFAWLLWLIQVTWRKDIEELRRLDRQLEEGNRLIAVFWHGKFFPLFSLLGGRGACVFASQSFRGQVIATICRRFGFTCVLLPEGGGKQSYKLMGDALRLHQSGAIAVDGPLGPNHIVKPGAIVLASELGFALLPISVAGRRSRVAEDRWDRREMPRPFTRVTLAIGSAVTVPAEIDRDGIQMLREQIRETLETLNGQAMLRTRSWGVAVAPLKEGSP